MKRSTLLALLFAAAVGGWILLFEQGDPEAEEADRVFGIEVETIEEVTLARPGFPEVRLARDGDGFTVAGGNGNPAPADETEADLLLQNVASLAFERRLDRSDSTDFGLDPAALVITVRGGGQARTALLGDETLAGGNRYLGFEDQVLVVPARAYQNFDRSAWDLRDLRVFRGAPEIRELRLIADDNEVALSRSGGDWTITAPFRLAADPFSAAQLSGQLADLRMTALAGGGDSGAEAPRLRAEVTLDRGGEIETRTVVFGDDRPPGVFARIEGDPLAFVVAEEPVKELEEAARTGLETIRSLRLFDFPVWLVNEAGFEGPDGEILFRRSDDGEATHWTLAGDPEPLVGAGVEDLLYRLISTDAEMVGDEPPAGDEPDWTIRVREEDASQPGTVRFWTSGDEVEALREGDERVLVLTREAWDEIRALLDAAAEPPEAGRE